MKSPSRVLILAFLATLVPILCRANLLHKPEEESDIFEGDIEISDDEEQALETGQAQAGQIGSHYRWPNGNIPYVIDNVFTEAEKKTILGSMKEISEKTCIKFLPRSEEKDYIKVIPGTGCSSHVGRQGTGQQDVKLNRPGCVRHGTVIHELVHAIGFWHEQSRTDRDDFVKVILSNVEKEKQHNFAKYTSKKLNDYGVPYDFDSVMHYPDNAFISNKALLQGKQTILPLAPGAKIGQRRYLSKLDALKINRMYCPERSDTSVAPTTTTTTARATTTTSATTPSPTPKPTTTAVSTTPAISSRFLSNRRPSPESWTSWQKFKPSSRNGFNFYDTAKKSIRSKGTRRNSFADDYEPTQDVEFDSPWDSFNSMPSSYYVFRYPGSRRIFPEEIEPEDVYENESENNGPENTSEERYRADSEEDGSRVKRKDLYVMR